MTNENTNVNEAFSTQAYGEEIGRSAFLVGEDTDSIDMNSVVTFVRAASGAHSYSIDFSKITDEIKTALMLAGLRESINNAFAGVEGEDSKREVILERLALYASGDFAKVRASNGTSTPKGGMTDLQKEIRKVAKSNMESFLGGQEIAIPAMKEWGNAITYVTSQGDTVESTYNDLYKLIAGNPKVVAAAEKNLASADKLVGLI